MSRKSITRLAVPATAIAVVFSLVSSMPASAGWVRTKGTGMSVSVSWTEYDADNLLNLPGNVHVGYLSAYSDMYGTYFYGNVTDFDCDPGEIPYGGHGIHEVIIDDAADTAEKAIEEVVDAVVDSNEGIIDADVVIDAIQADLAEDVPELIEDEFEEFPACDYVQDRFLEGQDTAVMTVDVKKEVATITGNLTVSTGGHGHGDPGTILGTPGVNITITGGEWMKYQNDSTYRGPTYMYAYWNNGTSFYGGSVTGGIGAMGFADDADDEAFGGFDFYRYRTTERVR